MKELLFRLSKVKYLSRCLIVLSDTFFSVFSSFCILFFFGIYFEIVYSSSQLLTVGLLSLICSLAGFMSCRTCKVSIRHSSYVAIIRQMLASVGKAVLFALFGSFFLRSFSPKFLYLFVVLDFMLSFAILTVIRVIIILLYSRVIGMVALSNENILIFKGGNWHDTVFHSPVSDKIGGYRLFGFLQIGTRSNLHIDGYPVYSVSSLREFHALVNKRNIKAILFIDGYTVKGEQERLVRYCEILGVRMLVLPEINVLNRKKIFRGQLSEVQIEDLLSRNEIEINMEDVSSDLKDKVVMVTGAAGSIGSEICRQLCTFGLKQLVLFDIAETPMHELRLELNKKFPDLQFFPILGDIRNRNRVEAIVERYRPQLIFHAAAYKHVPLMEENPCEAVRANVYGTCVMADSAVKYNVEKFVMISTDKAVNPTNVMGASKRLAEIYVQSLNGALTRGDSQGVTRFITTRFGNVLGSNGSVIPLFRQQIAKGGPVTVTHPDITRYFMTIPEACRLVLEAGTMGNGGEIFVFDMGEPVKIVDLAHRMISLAGLRPEIDIEIQYSGLRPGEKLFEELLSEKENSRSTRHPKIWVANVRDYKYHEIAPDIQQLSRIALSANVIETVRKMKEIIPEFISNNSKYEKLDRVEKKTSEEVNM